MKKLSVAMVLVALTIQLCGCGFEKSTYTVAVPFDKESSWSGEKSCFSYPIENGDYKISACIIDQCDNGISELESKNANTVIQMRIVIDDVKATKESQDRHIYQAKQAFFHIEDNGTYLRRKSITIEPGEVKRLDYNGRAWDKNTYESFAEFLYVVKGLSEGDDLEFVFRGKLAIADPQGKIVKEVIPPPLHIKFVKDGPHWEPTGWGR